ncbi:MAG: hypothetical protein JNM39_15740 [Bdellovibrionaceae bacterium]|nr:hypothetical protein [Pseudobdellovibrionaceae bacterium]
MLIKCPKCGFSQPQDQYCAQCGVDITNFKAPPTSAASKLFKDPVLHLGIVVLVALVSSVMLYRHQKSSIQDRVTYLRGNQFPQKIVNQDQTLSDSVPGQQPSEGALVHGETTPPNPASATPSVGVTAELPGPNQSEVLPSSGSALSGTVSGAPGAIASGFQNEEDKALLKQKKNTLASGNISSGKGGHYKVKVTYAEISQRSLENLSEESSKSGQYNNFGDYSAGIIMQAQKRLAGITKDMNIQRTDLDPIDLGKPLNWTLNYHSSDREPASQDISYSTFVNLEEVDNQVFKGNLEIVKSQKEPSESGGSSIQKSNYPAVFEISHDAAFFMSGLGARRADGSKSDSEFIVVVQFEKIESKP